MQKDMSMQYVLTQQEFETLQRDARMLAHKNEAELQALCTLAAQHIPIVMAWSKNKTPRPWGCILGPDEQDPGYCDDCPAQKVCPHQGKKWSK
jgi:hypothetical protein